ncbi:MAG: hypothetical protein H6719_18960 [Sandaracinaceae bacterium]|nr:hypothetical protein [Sandaracinaceae bacterium]
MTPTRRAPLLLAALIASVGCAEPLTQAILVVDTDVPLASPNPDITVEPNQLREISISLYGPCPDDGSDCPAIFEDSVQQYNLPGSVELPFSIGLLLEPDGDEGPYIVDVVATLGPRTDESTISVEAEFEFIHGETHAVPLYLVGACVNHDCADGASCGTAGTCEDTVRTGDGFPLWTDNLDDFSL